jgi:predicted molibdopterin-dependent oxidoreductase YjgC
MTMREIKGNCSLCSLACPLVFRGGARSPIFGEGSLLSLDWDTAGDSKYGGSLCARGSAMVEFVSHPERVNYPWILGERSVMHAAISETAKNLTAIKEEFGSDKIGILIGENLTVEEALLARAFAKQALGNENIALFAPDDKPTFAAYSGCDLSRVKAAGKREGDREVTLIVGDSFADHPCTAKMVLPGKYGTRGSEVIVISPERNNTSWFANRHLRCNAGSEAAVLAGLLKAQLEQKAGSVPAELEKLVTASSWNEIESLSGVGKEQMVQSAQSMLGAAKVRAYVSNIYGRFGSPALAALFSEAVARLCPGLAEFTPQLVQQNSWGIHAALAGADSGSVIEKLSKGELKALVILGLDIFSAFPAAPVEKALREKKFTVTTQIFWNQTASRANVVIPAAALVEKPGTVWPAFGESLQRDGKLGAPGGTVSDAEFLIMLAKEMGIELAKPAGVTEPARSGSCEWIVLEWSSYTGLLKELNLAETVLIPWSEPVHVGDGSVSRKLHWSSLTSPDPLLMISNEFADELGLEDGDMASVSSSVGEAALAVRKTDRLSGKIVGATIHFPAVRKLFPWKLDENTGEICLAPISVKIGRQIEKS